MENTKEQLYERLIATIKEQYPEGPERDRKIAQFKHLRNRARALHAENPAPTQRRTDDHIGQLYEEMRERARERHHGRDLEARLARIDAMEQAARVRHAQALCDQAQAQHEDHMANPARPRKRLSAATALRH